jgi:hypothetical protein
MTMRRTFLVAPLALALLPLAARAHIAAGARGPNGGQVEDLGPYHGELLAKDGELTLFLFDSNDRPVPLRDASGTATVLAEGKQANLTFAPRADGAALVATGDFKAVRGMRVVVQVVPRPGMARVQARFTPLGA